MYRTFTLLFSAGTFKITPLIQSALIIYFAGADYYADFGYYLISAMFASTLFSVGIVPAFVRSIGLKEEEKITKIDFMRFVIFAMMLVILGFSLLTYFGFFGQRNGIVAMFMGLFVGLNSMLLPLLIISGAFKYTIICSGIFLIITLITAIFSGWVPKYIFEYLFLIAPSIVSILFTIQFLRLNQKDFLKKPTRSFFNSILTVSKEISPIFLPNVFWMGALFLFSHRVSNFVDSPELFTWYAIGLQIYGIFVFIPNTLGPLILLKMSVSSSNDSFKMAFAMSFLLISISFVIYLLAWSIITWGTFIQIDSTAKHIWLYISAAGVVAAGYTATNNLLVRLHRAYLIGVGAGLWALIAHISITLAPNYFEVSFLVANIIAFLGMLLTIFIVQHSQKIVKESNQ